jgi:uncharacterized membrane protein YuzA (DUF378 family)
MTGWTKLFLTLTIIGAINWGLIGFFDFNLIGAIFGHSASENASAISRIIYAIVGLCGIGLAAMLPRLRETPVARVPPLDRRPDVRV